MRILIALVPLALIPLMGCWTTTSRVGPGPARPTNYEDPGSPGRVAGAGLHSQDIVSMTDRMVRDILASPAVVSRSRPPRIVLDSEFFRNESSSIINKNLFTDRLRVELVRRSGGHLQFIARHQAALVEKERILEDAGVVSGGTLGETPGAVGYDFRLGGRIASLDAIEGHTGMRSTYHQITFELIERGSGLIVWTNNYEIRKTAIDDIRYR